MGQSWSSQQRAQDRNPRKIPASPQEIYEGRSRPCLRGDSNIELLGTYFKAQKDCDMPHTKPGEGWDFQRLFSLVSSQNRGRQQLRHYQASAVEFLDLETRAARAVFFRQPTTPWALDL